MLPWLSPRVIPFVRPSVRQSIAIKATFCQSASFFQPRWLYWIDFRLIPSLPYPVRSSIPFNFLLFRPFPFTSPSLPLSVPSPAYSRCSISGSSPSPPHPHILPSRPVFFSFLLRPLDSLLSVRKPFPSSYPQFALCHVARYSRPLPIPDYHIRSSLLVKPTPFTLRLFPSPCLPALASIFLTFHHITSSISLIPFILSPSGVTSNCRSTANFWLLAAVMSRIIKRETACSSPEHRWKCWWDLSCFNHLQYIHDLHENHFCSIKHTCIRNMTFSWYL